MNFCGFRVENLMPYWYGHNTLRNKIVKNSIRTDVLCEKLINIGLLIRISKFS